MDGSSFLYGTLDKRGLARVAIRNRLLINGLRDEVIAERRDVRSEVGRVSKGERECPRPSCSYVAVGHALEECRCVRRAQARHAFLGLRDLARHRRRRLQVVEAVDLKLVLEPGPTEDLIKKEVRSATYDARYARVADVGIDAGHERRRIC